MLIICIILESNCTLALAILVSQKKIHSSLFCKIQSECARTKQNNKPKPLNHATHRLKHKEELLLYSKFKQTLVSLCYLKNNAKNRDNVNQTDRLNRSKSEKHYYLLSYHLRFDCFTSGSRSPGKRISQSEQPVHV